jgi:hypothetical protein
VKMFTRAKKAKPQKVPDPVVTSLSFVQGAQGGVVITLQHVSPPRPSILEDRLCIEAINYLQSKGWTAASS